ncbi:MAG: single-stranded-DNA-specific exonuclease RecJ [Myxococcales bacterium]|nr:single-stranded-DNA-specific exonuclease RecJ [Myxococcales bacterium]
MVSRWQIPRIDDGQVDALCRQLGLRRLTAEVLVRRGMGEPEHAHKFLTPRLADLRSPKGIADLDRALERLVQAVGERETVGVFGDYDVDGVTSAAVLTSGLRALGGVVEARCASRSGGYGFTLAAAERFVAAGCTLVITADCGTSDHASIGWLRERGVPVVVIDHHQVPRGDHVALALVNPHRDDDRFAFKGLASCGLAFYLVGALRTRLKQLGNPRAAAWDPRELLDLVALGTVADVMPLTHENRALVAAGLRTLSTRRRPGVAALAQVSAMEADRDVTAVDIGFRLAPRLNAAGRLGDAQLALDLLLAPDAERALRLAQALDEQNRRRQEIQEAVLAAADAEVAALVRDAGGQVPAALVVGDEGWHHGVVGIVAAKLVDRYARPSLVIGFEGERGRGSARTVPGFNLYRALADTAGHLEVFGGHAAAAGLTIRRAELEAFRAAFVGVARVWQEHSEDNAGIEVDAVVQLADLDLAGAEDLARLAPFGCGNAEPLLALCRVTASSSRVVGGSHLQLTLSQEGVVSDAIAFGMAEQAPAPGVRLDLLGCFEVNAFRGSRRPRLRVKHIFEPEVD